MHQVRLLQSIFLCFYFCQINSITVMLLEIIFTSCFLDIVYKSFGLSIISAINNISKSLVLQFRKHCIKHLSSQPISILVLYNPSCSHISWGVVIGGAHRRHVVGSKSHRQLKLHQQRRIQQNCLLSSHPSSQLTFFQRILSNSWFIVFNPII